MDDSRPDEAGARVHVLGVEQLIATGFSVVRQATIDYRRFDGSRQVIRRETYDRGNGAAILLFDPSRDCVLLVRQFRYPAYANPTARDAGMADRGWLVEVPAGLLDDHLAAGLTPEQAIQREVAEEAGVTVGTPRHIMELYSSPGSVTERLALFVSTYSERDKTSAGGGLATEGEDIQILEPTLDEAFAMIATGEIADSKTVLLLLWAKLNREELVAAA